MIPGTNHSSSAMRADQGTQLWSYIENLFMFYTFLFQSKYVAECLDEIKSELRQENIAIKAIAVNKLTYVSIRCHW